MIESLACHSVEKLVIDAEWIASALSEDVLREFRAIVDREAAKAAVASLA